MTKCKFLGIALTASLLAACTADPADRASAGGSEHDAVIGKLIHTSNNADEGKLLLYVNDDAVEAFEAAVETGETTRSGLSDVDEVLYNIGATSIERLFVVDKRHEANLRAEGMHRWYVVRFDEDQDLDQAAVSFAALADIDRVEFCQKVKKCGWSEPRVVDLDDLADMTRAVEYQFNDPSLPLQWHYINTGDPKISSRAVAGADINVAPAWKLETGNRDIVVAVVDEAVDYTHEDLAANMWINEAEKNGEKNTDDDDNGYKDDIYGYNFHTPGPLTWNRPGDTGHGTHVAGTVAAVNNNALGVSGVAGGSGNNDGVRIMSCQIFSNNTGAGVDASARAIQYAANNGACILQCSWGTEAMTPGLASDSDFERNVAAEHQALVYFAKYAKSCPALDGGLIVFAAGNDTKPQAGYPAAYNNIIAVTSFSSDGLPAYYTNYGPGCNIAAPGGDAYEDRSTGRCSILSTLPNGRYGYMDGTSMACPHVSGIAALGLSYALKLGKTFTVDEYKALLLTSVNDINARLVGTRESKITQNLADYKGKMGTGTIDTFQVLMNVRGTRCIPVKVGGEESINIQNYLGSGELGMKMTAVEMAASDMAALGITEKPVVFGNNIVLKCTKPGAAIIKVNLIAGGTAAGGGATMGGMLITKEFAIIARPAFANNGGWL